MKNIRVIARLDIKAPNVVKGIHLEGLRKIGNPNELALRYYEQGADEIIYMDIVASLYNRNSLEDIVRDTTRDIFIPITVAGGIRSVEDARNLLNAGADKIAINTAAIKDPNIIREISQTFGSQCMVISIEAKKQGDKKWEVYYDNGRERTGIDVIEWVKKAYELGAGEVLLTSIDKEGTKKGFDIELVKAVSEAVPIPVIASGGLGKKEDFSKVVYEGQADAVAIGSVLHYNQMTIQDIKQDAYSNGINIRRMDYA